MAVDRQLNTTAHASKSHIFSAFPYECSKFEYSIKRGLRDTFFTVTFLWYDPVSSVLIQAVLERGVLWNVVNFCPVVSRKIKKFLQENRETRPMHTSDFRANR